MEQVTDLGQWGYERFVSVWSSQFDWQTIAAYGIGLLLLYILVRLLVVPLRLTLSLIVNSIIGMGGLLLFNVVGTYLDFRLAVNPITALIVGFLGLPGLGLLIALRFVFDLL